MINKKREKAAKDVAESIILKFPELVGVNDAIGVILGTGWGDAFSDLNFKSLSLGAVSHFFGLETIEGHARKLLIGKMGNRTVIVLQGRIHLNEVPYSRELAEMARLQIETLFHLGVKTLITTAAVGGLDGRLKVGNVAIVDGLITVFAPDMPLWAGEFCSPEDSLSLDAIRVAKEEAGEVRALESSHAMVRGPFFEGRKYDKNILRSLCAGVVGMSILPEACIASLYEVKVLALCLVTNSATEVHSHEENLRRAAEIAPKLSAYLERIIRRI